MKPNGNTPRDAKNANLKIILSEIRKCETIQRIDLSKRILLSKPSISKNIEILMHMGLVDEVGVIDTATSLAESLHSSEPSTISSSTSKISKINSSNVSSSTSSTANNPVVFPKYSTDTEIPIGMFWPGPLYQMSQEWINELAAIGSNFIEGTATTLIQENLDWAQNAGLKVLIYDSVENMSGPEAVARIKDFINHPAYLGIQVTDEPNDLRINVMSNACLAMREFDPDGLVWVNLLPSYGSFSGFSDYERHVRLYIEKCNPNLLSYDNYAIVGDDIRGDFYENARIFSSLSKEFDIPFWTFALCTLQGSYTNNTSEAMMFQVANELAMGTRGLQWFTMGKAESGFYSSPLDENGNRSDTFYRVKAINEAINTYDHILMSMDYIGTLFAIGDEDAPVRKEFTAWEPVSSVSGDPVVVGCFEDKNGNKALYVANYDYKKAASFKIILKNDVFRQYKVWDGTGDGKVYNYSATGIELSLAPGGGVLIQLGE